MDLPDFVSGEVQDLELDRVAKEQDQVSRFSVEPGIAARCTMQEPRHFLRRIDGGRKTILLSVIEARQHSAAVLYEAPVEGLQDGAV
ncbi:hypothetical protein ACQR1H_02240 [Bradyrhizobium sp. HKCCYLRH2015]|uniref:hypothetical protein n=1 Tax=Bradyrhizobium sp. HKCCYLRH2015 TaxID=3420742 RepID=UPI003EB93E59